MSFFKRIPYRSIGLYLLKVLTFAVVYRLATVFSLSMAYAQANASPVFPPTGIALATLLLFDVNLWPGITLAMLVGSLTTGATPLLAIGMAAGNTLEAIAGALLLKRVVKFQNSMERLQDVVGLLLVSLVCTTISASFGTLSVILYGQAQWTYFGNIWTTWWIGDLLGALVIAPLLLTWLASGYSRPKWREAIESAILFALLSALAVYVFSNQPPIAILHQALLYVIFPLMIWDALRFGQRGTSLGIVLVSGIAIWGTIHNNGPFALESLNDSLILLQTFTGVVSITSLVLASVTAERRKATETIQRRYSDLSTLNNATRSFLGNLDNVNIFQTIADMAVHQLGLDAAWVESIASDEAGSQVLASKGIKDTDIRTAQAGWKARLQQGALRAPQIIFPSKDGMKKHVAADQFQVQGIFPLAIGNQPLGFLNVLSKQRSFFTSDRQLLIQSFTNLAAVAIQNNYLFDSVRKGNEQLHALSQRLMKAQEEERLHLSRELHDESGQLLAAMMVQLGVLEHGATKSKSMAKRVQELKRITNDIQTNLHKLAVNLRPASLDHLGLVTTLQQYVTDFSHQHGIKVDFEAVGLERSRLPIEIETAVFRIVQESLTNVILHAKATRIDVLLSRCNGHLVAVVEDDGIGFISTSPDVGEHIGLFGMRERIEMLGGTFTIETAPGKGTTVKVEVPCGD